MTVCSSLPQFPPLSWGAQVPGPTKGGGGKEEGPLLAQALTCSPRPSRLPFTLPPWLGQGQPGQEQAGAGEGERGPVRGAASPEPGQAGGGAQEEEAGGADAGAAVQVQRRGEGAGRAQRQGPQAAGEPASPGPPLKGELPPADEASVRVLAPHSSGR